MAGIDAIELEWKDDRSTKGAIVDVTFVPQIHHRVGKLPLEANVKLCIGGAIPALTLPSSNHQLNPGLSIGATAGVTYFFAQTVGVSVETGVRTTRLGLSVPGPQDTLSWTQWNVLNLSLVAAF